MKSPIQPHSKGALILDELVGASRRLDVDDEGPKEPITVTKALSSLKAAEAVEGDIGRDGRLRLLASTLKQKWKLENGRYFRDRNDTGSSWTVTIILRIGIRMHGLSRFA